MIQLAADLHYATRLSFVAQHFSGENLRGQGSDLLKMEEEIGVVKTFAELGVREELVKACERLGWKIPTKIQSQALPYALEGRFFLYLRCS